MKYQRTTLSNGSSLTLLKIPESNSITVSAFIKAGFRFDPIGKPGLAHFTEHMLFSGTKKYPSQEILGTALERHGGFHSAFTWIDYQHHYVHSHLTKFNFSVDVLLESLFHSTIGTQEIKKEKGVVKEETERNLSDPDKAVWNYAWLPLLFHNTPLSRYYTGTLKDIKSITKKDVLQFIHTYFHKSTLAYFVAGNISLQKAQDTLNKYVYGYKNSQTSIVPKAEIKSKIRVLIENRKTDHASLMIGVPTVSLGSFDRHALNVLVNMLSRWVGGSLQKKLRDCGGLIYTLSGNQDNLMDTGYLTIMTSCHKNNILKVIEIIINEFQRLIKGNMTNEEIEISKGNLIGNLQTNMETGMDYIHWYGLQELFNPDKIIHIKDQVEIYEKISKETLMQTAAKYLGMNNIRIAVYGDVKQNEVESLIL